MQQEQIPSRLQSTDFDLMAFVKSHLKYLWLFVITIPLFLSIAWAYNWYATPLYAVSTKLMIDDEGNAPDDYLKELDLEPKSKIMENEIEVLRSHSLVAEAVRRLEFDVSYHLIGNYKTSEVYRTCPFKISSDSLSYDAYFTSYEVHIDSAEKGRFIYTREGEPKELDFTFGRSIQMPEGRILIEKRSIFDPSLFNDSDYEKRRYRVKFNTLDQSKNLYLSKLNITKAREGSTILELSLLDEVPLKAMDFLDTLTAVYIQYDAIRKNNASKHKQAFINDQLAVISRELNEVERDNERYKSSKGIVNLDAEAMMIVQRSLELETEVAELENQVRTLEKLQQYVTSSRPLSDIAPSALDVRDPLLASLINDLNDLEQERKESSIRFEEGALGMGNIDTRLQGLKATIVESAKNTLKNMNETLEASKDRKAAVDLKISRIPGAQRELKNIDRELNIKQNLYTYMLERQAEVNISLAATTPTNRVLDRARTLPGPVSPIPSRAYSIALLLGLLLPGAFIFVRERLRDTVTGRKMIEKLCDVPIIGTLGINKSESALVIQEKGRSAIAESFRAVRTNLKYFTGDKEHKVLLITSSVGGEGKTFSAMNIAGSLAISGSKTVLLGLDLRKPKLSLDIDIDPNKGLSSYLIGAQTLEEVTQTSKEIDGLDIIPSGPVPPNPSELIMSSKMDAMMEELKEKYDQIVIDSPPVGLVTDGLLLAKYADASIYLVRQNFTKKVHLNMVDELYKQNKLPQLSILFNAVKNDHEGGYGGYGHGYGYGYYDEEPTSKGKAILKKTKELLSET